jgi:hypothetical protein
MPNRRGFRGAFFPGHRVKITGRQLQELGKEGYHENRAVDSMLYERTGHLSTSDSKLVPILIEVL